MLCAGLTRTNFNTTRQSVGQGQVSFVGGPEPGDPLWTVWGHHLTSLQVQTASHIFTAIPPIVHFQSMELQAASLDLAAQEKKIWAEAMTHLCIITDEEGFNYLSPEVDQYLNSNQLPCHPSKLSTFLLSHAG